MKKPQSKGKIILDDGSAHQIVRTYLNRGLIYVECAWADSFKTAEHYRVVGPDGQQVWDALFRMAPKERGDYADLMRKGFSVWVELSVSIRDVSMVGD